MVCINSTVNVKQKHTYHKCDPNKSLVLRTLLSENCYCSLQLELARQNYMNRKIEKYKSCLVMQKALVKDMHRKIVFVKVESSVIEISESVH